MFQGDGASPWEDRGYKILQIGCFHTEVHTVHGTDELMRRGQRRSSQGDLYRSTEAQCQGCPQKKLCTAGPYRRLFVHWQEPARQTVRALAGTPEYKRSQRARYKVEALFAELKQQIKLRRVRLRRLWNVAEQFYLAAAAQNLKRLVRHLAHRRLQKLSTA